MLRIDSTARRDHHRISYCPLCRAILPRDVDRNSPLRSGLPDGESGELADLEAEYCISEGPVNRNPNRTRRSPVQIIRSMIRERRQRRARLPRQGDESGNAYLTGNENAELDIQLRDSLVREREDLAQRQARLADRVSAYENLVDSYTQESLRTEFTGMFEDILNENRRLRRHYRNLLDVVTRHRRFPNTRRRIVLAWGTAWPEELRERFVRRQRILAGRLRRLRGLVGESEQTGGEDGGEMFRAVLRAVLVGVVLFFVRTAWSFIFG